MANWGTILKTLMIEKDIPVPKRAPREVVGLRDKLDLMQIGDSLFVERPDDWPAGMRFFPVYNATKTLTSKKFTQRTIGNGIRIWRIA